MPGKEGFPGDDNQQPFAGTLVTGAWLCKALWEGSGPEGKFKAVFTTFTNFSVRRSPEAQSRFRSEKGTKLSVGDGHLFVTQRGVCEVGSREGAQRGCISSPSPAANLMCDFGHCTQTPRKATLLLFWGCKDREEGNVGPDSPSCPGQWGVGTGWRERERVINATASHRARPWR